MAELLRAGALGTVPHGFSTRDGAAGSDVLPGAQAILSRQVHSPDVVEVDGPWAGDPPEADALVTDRRGLVIGVVTADCAPVLLADAAAGVVGAAHAGWRGAVEGVIANTVAAMERLGAQAPRISAAIGPCIAQESYEVDAPFRARFSDEDAEFFVPGREGHWQFDLPGFVAANLAEAGVGRVERLARDTYAEEDSFHSYRRATHNGTNPAGRQLSMIALR